MFIPGNSFADYLLLGVSFLPLLPALVTLVRKLYGQEPFNYLAVICLLCFFQGLLRLVYSAPPQGQYLAGRAISLLLFLFYFLAFRSNLGGKLRYGLNLLMTALLSILCTYWWLKGWEGASPITEMLTDGFLALVVGISLRTIIRNDELGVFRHPLFWIEGGTLFYILLFLLLG